MYRRLALERHPDKFPDELRAEATKEFQLLQAASRTLCNSRQTAIFHMQHWLRTAREQVIYQREKDLRGAQPNNTHASFENGVLQKGESQQKNTRGGRVMDMFTNFVCKQTHNPQGSAIHKFTAQLQTCEQSRPGRRKLHLFFEGGGDIFMLQEGVTF